MQQSYKSMNPGQNVPGQNGPGKNNPYAFKYITLINIQYFISIII